MKFVDVKNDIAFRKIAAYQDANKHSWTKEELEAYDYAAMREQDERGKLIQAEKKGRIDVAREMQKEGFDNATISRLTGLSDEEIENL